MIKFRLYWDKDKEELWLNEMVQEGWAMTGFCLGFYSFDPCEKGEYIYQIDLFTERKEHMSYSEYLSLLQETGAEYVVRWGPWRVFRRRTALGEFRLYTDAASRIEQLERIFRFFRVVLVIESAIMVYQLFLTVIYWNAHWSDDTYRGIQVLVLLLALLCVSGFGVLCYRIKRKIAKLKIN